MITTTLKKVWMASATILLSAQTYAGATYTEIARWPEGKIPYFTNNNNEDFRRSVDWAVGHWEQNVSSIDFVKLEAAPAAGSAVTFVANGKTYTTKRWVEIVREAGFGCSTNTPPMQGSTQPSGVVKVTFTLDCLKREGDNRVTLAKEAYPDLAINETDEKLFAERETAVHELGHVIGLVHEHERMEAANYVNVDFCQHPLHNTVGEECTVSGPVAGQFMPATINTPLNSYDYLSVMHYDIDLGSEQILSVHQGRLAEVQSMYPNLKQAVFDSPMVSSRDISAVNSLYSNHADHRIAAFNVTEPSTGAVQLTATVANVGPYASNNSRFVVNIPTQLSALTPTLSGDASTCTRSASILTCNFGSLEVFASRSITLRYSGVNVAYDAFTATASSSVPEPTIFQHDNIRRSVSTRSSQLRHISTVKDNTAVGGLTVSRLNGADQVAYVNGSTAGILHAYIGSRDDDGLVVLSHNTANGAVSRVQEIANGALNNGFTAQLDDVRKVLVSKSGNHVYVFPRRQSSFNVFSRNPTTGVLTLVQVVTQGQVDPYGMVIDGLQFYSGLTSRGFMDATLSEDGNWLYAVNDRLDSLAVFNVSNGGRVGFESILKDGQHGTYFTEDPVSVKENPRTGVVYVSSAGDNAISVFTRENGYLSFSGHRGNTEWAMNPIMPVLSDVGGRTFMLTRGNTTVNVNNISLWTLDPLDFMPVSQRRISQLGADQNSRIMNAVQGANNAVMSGDGNLLFSTSYNEDAITIYRVNAASNGLTILDQLKHNKRDSTGSLVAGLDGAAGIALSPDGRFLVVTGMASDSVSFYAVDPL